MDVRKTAERFRSSGWVARFWPAALRASSAGYFPLQQGINLPQGVAAAGAALETVASVLDQSGLKTPIYWLLGSSVREAELARNAASGAAPGVAYVRGVDALAQRDLALAARHFEAALGAGDQRALGPLLLSACRSGQTVRARQLAASYAQVLAPSRFTRCQPENQ